jgi:hypothetical protein
MADREEALLNLLGEVDAAAEVLYGRGLRDVPGRQSGYHDAVARGVVPPHLEYPSERKGGSRRHHQMGGAACDNRWVRLAVDSAIVLAGAGAVVGVSYGGFTALQYYMKIYQVGPAVTQIVTALYEELVKLITEAIPAAAGSAASVATSGMNVASAVISAASKLAKPALPGVALYRYYFQGASARDDAVRVFDEVSTKARNTKEFVEGVMTRSRARKAALQASIAATSHQTKEALSGARDTVVGAGFAGMAKAAQLKDIICDIIDKVANGTISAINQALAVTHILAALRQAGDDVPPAAAAAAAAPIHHSPRAAAAHRSPSPPGRAAAAHRSPSPRGARAASPRAASPRAAAHRRAAAAHRSPSPGRVDNEASEAMRKFIFQGGKHRKRTMHKRSRKHHKKSRKHSRRH